MRNNMYIVRWHRRKPPWYYLLSRLYNGMHRRQPSNAREGEWRISYTLAVFLLIFFHFLFFFFFFFKGWWSRVYERVKKVRDIRWMLRCVDIDDGKALKSKTGRIELWLSEDRLKIVERDAVERLRSRTFCDSADRIRTRVVGYSRWELHLGNLDPLKIV